MSSWAHTFAGRLLVAVAVVGGGCKPGSSEHELPPPPARPPASARAPITRPWFEGTWTGTGEDGGAIATLEIDQAGNVRGQMSSDLGARGLVDEDTVRLEADGPGGHGVAVLHRQGAELLGVLHHATPGAQVGSHRKLLLRRADAP